MFEKFQGFSQFLSVLVSLIESILCDDFGEAGPPFQGPISACLENLSSRHFSVVEQKLIGRKFLLLLEKILAAENLLQGEFLSSFALSIFGRVPLKV